LDGELFIIGRIKDLLIVYGRNHSPDDIEATIQEITRGRCAAISVPDERMEKLVAIIEFKNRGDSDEDAMHKLDNVKGEVTSAISNTHGLGVADLVLVPPGSIPITIGMIGATCMQLASEHSAPSLSIRRPVKTRSGVPSVEPPSTRTGSKSLQVCRATLSRQARGVAATLLC
jgi:hypothetical protein